MADKEKKEKKSKSKKNFLSTVLKDTTIGGGIGVQDTEYETIPSATLNLTKGKTTVEGSLAKGFSKVDDQNINSEIGLNITRQNDNSSLGITGSKMGKNKQNFIKALKKLILKYAKKCGQKLPEDWDEYEARYA